MNVLEVLKLPSIVLPSCDATNHGRCCAAQSPVQILIITHILVVQAKLKQLGALLVLVRVRPVHYQRHPRVCEKKRRGKKPKTSASHIVRKLQRVNSQQSPAARKELLRHIRNKTQQHNVPGKFPASSRISRAPPISWSASSNKNTMLVCP